MVKVDPAKMFPSNVIAPELPDADGGRSPNHPDDVIRLRAIYQTESHGAVNGEGCGYLDNEDCIGIAVGIECQVSASGRRGAARR